MRPSPTSILITGASSGIGEALARGYAAPGIRLFLGGRNRDRLAEVVDACRDKGADASLWVGDVTDAQGLRQWIGESNSKAPLNLVIANAGVALGSADVAGLHDIAVKTYAINVTGVFNTIHPALELMAQRPYPVLDAQVAIVSSVMGYLGTARSPAYSTSKGAVKLYGQALRGAFRKMGIGVSVICPGYVESRLTARHDFRMPFLISAEQAARIIISGIARNKARITFPWQMTVLARIVMNLPNALVDYLNRSWGVMPLENQHPTQSNSDPTKPRQ